LEQNLAKGSGELRIALFTDSYDSYRDYNDGVAVFAQKFTKYAARKELFLRVFTNDYADWTEEISETVKVYRFKPAIPWYLYKYNEMPMDLVVPNPRLMTTFEQTPFDVIHFTQPCIMGLNALYAAGRTVSRFPLTVPAFIACVNLPLFQKRRSCILPLVGTFFTDIPAFVEVRTGSKFLRRRSEETVDNFYKNCDIVLATSRHTQKEIAQYIRGKVFGLSPSGVDTDSFHPRKKDESFRKALRDKIILLFAGRVTPEKNIHFLKDVYVTLRKRHSDIHLFIAGDGELRKWLQQELGNDVTAPGFLYGEDLYRAFASSDIFIFPSTTDTLGLVILEAQASGLPVVVMDQGGPKEVMEDGKTGFLCKARVVDDFAEKIHRLITDPEMRERMGKEARILAERFTWDQVFDGLLKVYEEVVNHD
jgi:glycosyltransferase involved in cell wall biosynthesis